MKNLFYCVLILSLFSSCARSYHKIYPEVYNYENNKMLKENVNMSYYYDVQHVEENKPYSRKEKRTEYKMVAVKIENNSDSVITLTRDKFFIKSDAGRDIRIVENDDYTRRIRQYVETYILFYGIAGIGNKTTTDVFGNTQTEFIYNPIPLLIGVGNAIFAAVANNNQKTNLEESQIFNRPVSPGSTMYGLIIIKDKSYPELNFFMYK